jgi:hypothetical protein
MTCTHRTVIARRAAWFGLCAGGVALFPATVTGAMAAGRTVSATAASTAARISNFSPKQGPQGVHVTITGRNLAPAKFVTFGGIDAKFKVKSSRVIVAIAPANGSGLITVVTSDAGTVSTNTTFVVTTPKHT